MKIERKQIKIGDIAKNYKDSGEKGVVAFDGKLNVRPAYQREYVYKERQRNAVINTIYNEYPLSIFYWVKGDDGTYEILDGQQRTISFCQFINNEFSMSFGGNRKKFFNLTTTEQQRILDYEIDVYVCIGSDEERLRWFETINTAGEPLTPQELRNANYTGPWLSDAKYNFSRTNCAAYGLGKDYIKARLNRQEFLEKALMWISDGDPTAYMAEHQHDKDAKALWTYYEGIFDWISKTSPVYREEMKGLDWGRLWKTYHENKYDPDELEKQIAILMANESVTKKAGIYEFVLSGQNMDFASALSVREFSESDKRTAWEKQKGIDPTDGLYYDIKDMEADHIIPWCKGGTSTLDNLQMISKKHNRQKGAKIII